MNGEFSKLVFSLKCNNGMTPVSGQSVEVYLVVIPYDGMRYCNSPITLTKIKNFLESWENIHGTLIECTGIATATESDDVPTSTKIGLKTVLNNGEQCAICSNGDLPINSCDIFAIWVRPFGGFTSFKPSVSLILGTQ